MLLSARYSFNSVLTVKLNLTMNFNLPFRELYFAVNFILARAVQTTDYAFYTVRYLSSYTA